MKQQTKNRDAQGAEAEVPGLIERVKAVFLYLLLLVVLLLSFGWMGRGDPWEYLLLAVSVALVALIGFRLHLAGAIGVILLLLFVTGGFLATGSGYFEARSFLEGLWFGVGFVGILGTVSVLSALVLGYNRRTIELVVAEQNMMHKVFDALPIGIWVRARSGRTIFVNERWAEFSPYSAQAILASDSTEPPVDLGRSWELEVESTLASNDGAVRYESVELTDNWGNALSMTLLTLSIYIDQVADVGTLSLLVDETDIRFYEERLRTSEHRLRSALNNAEMGILDRNLENDEVYCDANWREILGMDADEDGDPLETWKVRLHPDDRERVLAVYSGFLKGGEDSTQIDYRIQGKGGRYIWVQDRVRIVERFKDGSPRRVMGTMQDVSDRKRTEIDLKRAKERAEAGSEAKGHFLATISHEIRTPLNAIIGLSSFLIDGELEGEQLDLAQTIYSSGKSLLLLMNDILDFSKIEAGRLDLEVQEYPLRLCFEDCIKLFKVRAIEKQVDLKLLLDDGVTDFALGDMERLRQVVQNLLANALKFTEAGEVRVSVRRARLDELPADRHPDLLQAIGYLDEPDHDYLEVVVQDTGIGIPEDRQHVLFEAFRQGDPSTTRKYGGTGLGLAICRRLVSAMGGTIWVDSADGEGASFGFVVRTKLITDSTLAESPSRSPFETSTRIVEEHPCDILVVGQGIEAEQLIASCRKLGYAPHHSASHDLKADAFPRRRYNIIFVSLSDEAKGLDFCRQLRTLRSPVQPNALIGFTSADQVVAKEHFRFSALERVIRGEPTPSAMRDIILEVLHAPD